MTNYIIAPQVFYWINILSIIQTVLGIFGGICTAAFICMSVGWIYNACEAEKYESESNQFYMKVCKKMGYHNWNTWIDYDHIFDLYSRQNN